MTLYALSAILLFFACIVESFRKRGGITWLDLIKATALAVVLALPVMLPFVLFLIIAFDVSIQRDTTWWKNCNAS